MLSIIICSKRGKIDDELAFNIKNTVGCPFEFLIIDNALNNFSIFQAYNIGIQRSRYPYLIFVHEDVKFHTFNWGHAIVSYFKDPSLGLLGIAGSKIKTTIPSAWWNNRPEHILMNVTQSSAALGKKEKISFGFKENLEEVVVIDGVFMAARKDCRIYFNEKLNGFHNYDQSISLEYRQIGYKVMVTNEIILEHFSEGNKDLAWLKSILAFHQLYRRDLPQTVGDILISKEDQLFTCWRLIYNSVRLNKKFVALKYWLVFFSLDPTNKVNFFMIKYFLNLSKAKSIPGNPF